MNVGFNFSQPLFTVVIERPKRNITDRVNNYLPILVFLTTFDQMPVFAVLIADTILFGELVKGIVLPDIRGQIIKVGLSVQPVTHTIVDVGFAFRGGIGFAELSSQPFVKNGGDLGQLIQVVAGVLFQ